MKGWDLGTSEKYKSKVVFEIKKFKNDITAHQDITLILCIIIIIIITIFEFIVYFTLILLKKKYLAIYSIKIFFIMFFALLITCIILL
jgi:hypothetical protein